MTVFSASQFNSPCDCKLSVFRVDHTRVAFLSAHGGIKRCLFHKDRPLLPLRQPFRKLLLGGQDCDRRLKSPVVISHKLCGHRRIDLIVDCGVRAHIIGGPPGLLGHLPLLFHSLLETALVDLISFFLQDLLGQIQRESIGIIQTERIGPGQYLTAGLLHLLFQII